MSVLAVGGMRCVESEAKAFHGSKVDAENGGCADLIEIEATGLVQAVTHESEEAGAVGK